MFGRVRIAASPEYSAVMLPDEAIATDQTNKFVYTVADDGTVGRKTVTLGPIIDGLRVIRTGVTPTDTVITKGLQRARPGIKVAPKMDQIKVTTAVATEEKPVAAPLPAAMPAKPAASPEKSAKSATAPTNARKQ